MAAKRYLWILFSLLFFAGCSDLEDTYSDYAGDGQIRYLAQCTDVKITPGWEKLNIVWKNSIDPMVDKIRITWTVEGQTEEVLLDPTTTEYTISDLQEGTYEVSICGIDPEGNTSLAYTGYVRPYTANHEVIQNFPQLIMKHFFVKNHLVLYFSDWNSSIEKASLSYTKADGTAGSLVLDSVLVTDNKYYLLEDEIKPATPVVLERTGNIGGDVIPLASVELSRSPVFSADFKALFKVKFGVETPTAEQLNSLEKLDIDYSLNSLEDVLSLPELKELHLARNRYQYKPHLSYTHTYPLTNDRMSVLYEDKERSTFALEVAHKICGLEVWRYNQHFLPEMTAEYLHPMENPVPEELAYFSTEDWEIRCEPQDEDGYDSGLDKLFDGDVQSCWKPNPQATWREHTITVSMPAKRTIQGIRLVQQAFGYDFQGKMLAPVMVKIQVSSDGYEWENATYVEENTVGNTSGEITVIRFPEPKEAAFIRFMFNDQAQSSAYLGVIVADIGVF